MSPWFLFMWGGFGDDPVSGPVDPPPPPPAVAKFDIAGLAATVTEPASGTAPLTFRVTRSGPTTTAHTVPFSVAGSGAHPLADGEYAVTTATPLTFGAGTTLADIAIDVSSGVLAGFDETLTVTLGTPSNGATLGTATTAIGTVVQPVVDTTYPRVGLYGDMGDKLPGPASDYWCKDVNTMTIDPKSAATITKYGGTTNPNTSSRLSIECGYFLDNGSKVGIPYNVVTAAQSLAYVVAVSYADMSDLGANKVSIASVPAKGQPGGPVHGVVTLRGDGIVTYQNDTNFPTGVDSMTITLVGGGTITLPIEVGDGGLFSIGVTKYPVPAGVGIEEYGGTDGYLGDRHSNVIVKSTSTITGIEYFLGLYQVVELAGSQYTVTGPVFKCGNFAKWNPNIALAGQRTVQWTSEDAAGLPIFPGLLRYEELKAAADGVREIPHALRMTVAQMRYGFQSPATHSAGDTNVNSAPAGDIWFLRQDFAIRSTSPPPVRAILRCIQKKGIRIADNGITGAMTGTNDPRFVSSAANGWIENWGAYLADPAESGVTLNDMRVALRGTFVPVA